MELVIFDDFLLRKNVITSNISISTDLSNIYFLANTPLSNDTIVLLSSGGTSLVNDGFGPILSVKGLVGSLINITDNISSIIITNPAPNITPIITGADGINVLSSYPNFTIVNTAPNNSVLLLSSGGTNTLVNDGVGPIIAIKGLTPGASIGMTNNASDIIITNSAPNITPIFTGSGGINVLSSYPNFTIVNTAPNNSVLLVSSGGTNSLVNDGVGPIIAIKGLTPGASIGMTDNASDIIITNSAPNITPILIGGIGIDILSSYPNFTITNTAPNNSVLLLSAGGTNSLVNDSIGPIIAVKGLTPGASIGMTDNTSDIIITNSAPNITPILIGGDGINILASYPNFTIVNTAPNITPILTGGDGISVLTSYPSFTIVNTAPNNSVLLLSSGGTNTLVNNGAGPIIAVKGLTPGASIGMTNGASFITITNSAPNITPIFTGSGGINVLSAYPNFTIVNTAPNNSVLLVSAGGTNTLVNDPNGPIISIKGLTPGASIGMTNNASDIIITNSAPNITPIFTGAGGISVLTLYPNFTIVNTAPNNSVLLLSSGGTNSLVNDSIGPIIAVKGLTPGVGIGMTDNTSSITITNSSPDQTVSLAGTGGISISGAYPSFTIGHVLVMANTLFGETNTTGYLNFAVIGTDYEFNSLFTLGNTTYTNNSTSSAFDFTSGPARIKCNFSGNVFIYMNFSHFKGGSGANDFRFWINRSSQAASNNLAGLTYRCVTESVEDNKRIANVTISGIATGIVSGEYLRVYGERLSGAISSSADAYAQTFTFTVVRL